MAPSAAYDDIADWYETEFLGGLNSEDPLELRRLLRELLGTGTGRCLEIGCGTGIHATQLRELGWSPVGVDISGAMLRHARDRIPAAQGDAALLPIRDGSMAAVVAVMVHTDMPAYPAVLREVARVLRPGGVFVHLGVHPCFCGGFADRGDPEAIVIRPGYLDGHWTKSSWSTEGVRARVGAAHWPLPELLGGFLDAGLQFERFDEGGAPIPIVFAVKARRVSRGGPTSAR